MRAAVPLALSPPACRVAGIRRWLRCLGAGLALVCLMAGCQVIDDETAPVDRTRLIEDMTKQLQRGSQVRYEAEYQLAGGHEAVVAQQVAPARTVYEYPGGLLIVAESEQTSCDVSIAPVKCQISGKNGQLTAYAEAAKRGLVTAPVVSDLLRLAAVQTGSTVKGHDTTIAGLQASCLEVLGLTESVTGNFTACVTADGILASFAGTVEGITIDLALVHCALRAPEPAQFEVPSGADVVDLRQG